MGVTFIYLGLFQKLAEPGQALLVVEKYNLTAVVPVDPGMWVLGAGLTEMLVGLVLIFGFMTRGAAAVSSGLFTTTLFGLPDDPVLAHITLFGMASAVFTMGTGPLSFGDWFGRPARATGRPSSRRTEPLKRDVRQFVPSRPSSRSDFYSAIEDVGYLPSCCG